MKEMQSTSTHRVLQEDRNEYAELKRTCSTKLTIV
jgi:hypothetical protein